MTKPPEGEVLLSPSALSLITDRKLRLDGVVAYFATKRQNGFVGGWSAMAREAFAVLKMFTRLEDFRVLMALMEQLDYENLIVATQATIAHDLGMQPSNVSSAIKRLVESGVILKGPKRGTNFSYQLNPEFGWKGSAANHKKALNKHQKEKRKLALVPEETSTESPDKDPA